MKKQKRIFLINTAFFSTLLCSKIWSQDLHFSNVEYAPLSLNPALSGTASSLQAIVNFRSQWNSIQSPYKTFGASIDGRLTRNRKNSGGFLAGGINVNSDKSGEVQLSENSVNLNLAYHLNINRESTIGIGMYGGFGQRSISNENAKWSNQYDGSGYNSAIGGEVLTASSKSLVDVGAGILYTSEEIKLSRKVSLERLNIGTAFYHVNTPNFSFFDNEAEKLNVRISAFVNGQLNFSNSDNAILPGIYYQKQGVASQLMFGANYKHVISRGSMVGNLNHPLAIYAGLFNRWNDALVLRFMMDYQQFMLGMSYDVTISKFRTSTAGRGGFEFFLKYNLDRKSGMSRI